MITEIVNLIKSRLGATHRKLELNDVEIVNILQNETLNTLSIYNPFYLEYLLDFTTNKVEESFNTFNLPTELEGFRIMGVEKVIPTSMSPGAMSSGWYGVMGGDLTTSMANYLNTKLMAGMMSVMLPPETFQFIPPNLLRVNNILNTKNAFVIMRTTHRKDFSTFHYGLRENIMKIALGDVANDLLGFRSYFQNIGTTFGEINLNTDQLKEWSDKREEVVENMRKSQLKNSGAKKIWMV